MREKMREWQQKFLDFVEGPPAPNPNTISGGPQSQRQPPSQSQSQPQRQPSHQTEPAPPAGPPIASPHMEGKMGAAATDPAAEAASNSSPSAPSASASAPPSVTPEPAPQLFAQQELRLTSALVLLIGLGLFLALPFVLSIGSVVFLPLTSAVILFVLLSPLAERMASLGLPNVIASFASLLIFFTILLLTLALIMQPAYSLFEELPAMAEQSGQRFAEIRDQFAWVAAANERIAELMGQSGANQVVMASPSMIEQLAVATPSVLLEFLLTFLLTFFMLQSRVQLRRTLFYDRVSSGTSIKAARILREVQGRVSAYISTVALINAGVGVVVALGAWALDVEAPIMWGGLAAILNFVPYIGPLAMTILLGLFGVGTTDTLLAGMLPAAAYLGLHTIEANLVTPSILGARFTMNPVMILIALMYFNWIWGVFGALLSVPILLMVTAFFDHIGKPNLIGFIFGEPLFTEPILRSEDDDPQLPAQSAA